MAVEATEARRGEKGTGALSAGETREGGAAPADRDAWGRVAVSGEDAEKLRARIAADPRHGSTRHSEMASLKVVLQKEEEESKF